VQTEQARENSKAGKKGKKVTSRAAGNSGKRLSGIYAEKTTRRKKKPASRAIQERKGNLLSDRI